MVVWASVLPIARLQAQAPVLNVAKAQVPLTKRQAELQHFTCVTGGRSVNNSWSADNVQGSLLETPAVSKTPRTFCFRGSDAWGLQQINVTGSMLEGDKCFWRKIKQGRNPIAGRIIGGIIQFRGAVITPILQVRRLGHREPSDLPKVMQLLSGRDRI